MFDKKMDELFGVAPEPAKATGELEVSSPSAPVVPDETPENEFEDPVLRDPVMWLLSVQDPSRRETVSGRNV